MLRMTRGGDKHFCFEGIVLPHFHNIGDELDSFFPDVVETADKGG